MSVKHHGTVFRGPCVARMTSRARRLSQAPLILCSILLMVGWTSDTPSSLPNPAHSASGVQDIRTPPTDQLTLVMTEATKLSLACRMFRDLYGRWPRDLVEIQAKTQGINFTVFAGRARVTPLPDDSERIEIFDGTNTREVKATAVDFGFTTAQRNAAKSPSYKIKL